MLRWSEREEGTNDTGRPQELASHMRDFQKDRGNQSPRHSIQTHYPHGPMTYDNRNNTILRTSHESHKCQRGLSV